MRTQLIPIMFITAAITLLIAGCGAKGDLYLNASEPRDLQSKEKAQ